MVVYRKESLLCGKKDINIDEVREIRTRTNVYFGVGAIQKN